MALIALDGARHPKGQHSTPGYECCHSRPLSGSDEETDVPCNPFSHAKIFTTAVILRQGIAEFSMSPLRFDFLFPTIQIRKHTFSFFLPPLTSGGPISLTHRSLRLHILG